MKGMRCRKHPTDFSSAVGVCASCLRHRLIAIIAAQTEAQQQQHQPPHQSEQQQQQQPYPLPFPRSVSPYISRRKSDTATWQNDDHDHHNHHHRRFFNTPQVGPTGSVTVEKKGKKNHKHHKGGLFSFLGIFRSKSNNKSDPNSDPGASPSWFSTIGRKKQTRAFSITEGMPIGVQRSIFGRRDRGMSPARYSDAEEDEHCHGAGSSGYSSESSNWKQTPRRTPARRAPVGNGRNLSVFCLSPLVRPAPCRLWSQKSAPPPETAAAGEARVPVKSHLSTAPSFCKNRSKKLADIGRYNHNSNY